MYYTKFFRIVVVFYLVTVFIKKSFSSEMPQLGTCCDNIFEKDLLSIDETLKTVTALKKKLNKDPFLPVSNLVLFQNGSYFKLILAHAKLFQYQVLENIPQLENFKFLEQLKVGLDLGYDFLMTDRILLGLVSGVFFQNSKLDSAEELIFQSNNQKKLGYHLDLRMGIPIHPYLIYAGLGIQYPTNVKNNENDPIKAPINVSLIDILFGVELPLSVKGASFLEYRYYYGFDRVKSSTTVISQHRYQYNEFRFGLRFNIGN